MKPKPFALLKNLTIPFAMNVLIEPPQNDLRVVGNIAWKGFARIDRTLGHCPDRPAGLDLM
jgi:hypothetical protein